MAVNDEGDGLSTDFPDCTDSGGEFGCPPVRRVRVRSGFWDGSGWVLGGSEAGTLPSSIGSLRWLGSPSAFRRMVRSVDLPRAFA
jgi:hypothetical protein